MIVTSQEKEQISKLEAHDVVKIDDETRSNVQYEVERVSNDEWKVSKWALMICLESDYCSSPEEVIAFIER